MLALFKAEVTYTATSTEILNSVLKHYKYNYTKCIEDTRRSGNLGARNLVLDDLAVLRPLSVGTFVLKIQISSACRPSTDLQMKYTSTETK
jgi:hypothetical protein